jgi:enoyl-CoA hydratase/carnithine racemase
MDGPQVGCSTESGIARLTIQRERQRNALSPQVISELLAHLDALEKDGSVRVVVLSGAGEKAFCAGGDLGGMAQEGGFLGTHDARRQYGRLLERLSTYPRPTLARVNGHALAGGLGLVLACDLAVAVDEAQFGTPEIDVGLFPMMVMALLQRHVGRKRALEWVMTGARFPAAEALVAGLVSRVVPRAELDTQVDALARTLAGKSRAVLTLGKRAFHAAEDLPFGPALELLASQLSLNTLAEDAAEGVSAFLEKRPPSWKDQ